LLAVALLRVGLLLSRLAVRITVRLALLSHSSSFLNRGQTVGDCPGLTVSTA
jgi:hypothetical protein